MSKKSNGLQSMADQVSVGHLGGWAEGATATEFSVTVMPAASWGVGSRIWDRASVGLSLTKCRNLLSICVSKVEVIKKVV